MASTSPIELPASNRRSCGNPAPTHDIHDPNWIPVLNGVDYRQSSMYTEKEVSPYATATLAPSPNRAIFNAHKRLTSSTQRKTSTKSSKKFVSELDAGPVPSGLGMLSKAASKNPNPQRDTSSESQSEDGGDTTAESNGPSSTMGTLSLVDEQHYILPGQPIPIEDPPAIPPSMSARNSVSSRRTAPVAVPTSKYNRKPVPSFSRPNTSGSNVPSASESTSQPPALPTASERTTQSHESPNGKGQQPDSTYSTPLIQPLTSAVISLPAPVHSPAISPIPPPTPQSATLRPKLHTMKSTTSERRARALHSHPSNVSLKLRNTTSSSDGEEFLLQQPRSKPRKSTDSSGTTSCVTVCDSQGPAANTPLPQLAPTARRPPTRDTSSTQLPLIQPPPPAHLGAPPTPAKNQEHAEIVSFMASNQTVVFRRFDEVHICLLTSLQDEISQLEKDLAAIGSSTAADKSSQKLKTMTDLRRVVAEYDHLFASWSSMQANKASETTKEDLKTWLEKSPTGASKGSKQDMEWLRNSKDLSSVSMRGEKQGSTPNVALRKKNTSGGGGLARLFASCAGRRT